MNEWIKKLCESITRRAKQKPYKWGFWFIFITLFLVPMLIWGGYLLGEYGHILFYTGLKAGEALGAYTSLLTFLGTSTLSILAIWQNKKIEEKAEQNKKLLQELDRQRSLPLLKVEQSLHSGKYRCLSFEVFNYSENIATHIDASPLIAIDATGNKVNIAEKPCIPYKMILSGNSVPIEYQNDELPADYLSIFFTLSYSDKYGECHFIKVIGTIVNNNMEIVQKDISKEEATTGDKT